MLSTVYIYVDFQIHIIKYIQPTAIQVRRKIKLLLNKKNGSFRKKSSQQVPFQCTSTLKNYDLFTLDALFEENREDLLEGYPIAFIIEILNLVIQNNIFIFT